MQWFADIGVPTMVKRGAMALDVNGQEIGKGDTVTTISGDLTGKVYDVRMELGTSFVRLRPVHQPYTPGIWHAADRVVRLKAARK
jgi:uncharacterized Zn ribbon protein